VNIAQLTAIFMYLYQIYVFIFLCVFAPLRETLKCRSLTQSIEFKRRFRG
jgi:hypothetical protein